MNALNINTYLLYAIYIVRTNPSILLFIGIIGLINSLGTALPESKLSTIAGSLTFITTVFAHPVIYGLYYGIIEDKHLSIAKIFTTYVAGYLLLIFSMYIPIITISAMIMTSAQFAGNIAMVMLTILAFSLIYLYVIPSYYISRTIMGSIITGVQFLLRNLLGSAPLLLMALFAELLLLLSQYKLAWLQEINLLLYAMIEFSVYMISSIIDFLLFIILIYILKSHGLKKIDIIT